MNDKSYESLSKFKWRNKIERNMTPCGSGSSFKSVKHIIPFINKIIKKYNIKTISDAGCGDFSWFNKVNLTNVIYTGYDINDEMLKEVQKNYPKYKFIHFDIVENLLPYSDLIICRDCLFHLDLKNAEKALNNFKFSKSTYIMCPTFNYTKDNFKVNSNSEGYQARRYNMSIQPFNLGVYIESIEEPTQDNRTLGMWRLN